MCWISSDARADKKANKNFRNIGSKIKSQLLDKDGTDLKSVFRNEIINYKFQYFLGKINEALEIYQPFVINKIVYNHIKILFINRLFLRIYKIMIFVQKILMLDIDRMHHFKMKSVQRLDC